MNDIFNSNILLPALIKYHKLTIINKYYELLDSQWMSEKEIEEYQFGKVKKIINYAYDNNIYYRNLFNLYGIKPQNIQNWLDFKEIPILKKKALSINFNNKSIITKKNGIIVQKRFTSGTSGIPICVLADEATYSYSMAARLRSEGWYGIKFGERQGRLWGRSSHGINQKKEILKDYLLNRIRLSASDINDINLSYYYKKLINKKATHLYGYSSMIVDFASFLKENNFDTAKLNFKVIIPTAEQIFKFQKNDLEKLFNCSVAEEYGSSEVEIMAYECPKKNMHIISENIYIEINKEVTNKDNGKIIITDLNNFLQPLIRYEIGDIGSINDSNCLCGRKHKILKSEITRTQNQYIYLRNGLKIHSVIFPHFIEGLIKSRIYVNKFKVVQYEDYSIDLFICIYGKINFDQKIIQNMLFDYFNKNNINILYCNVKIVNDIIDNGKYSYFETFINL